MSGSRPVNGPSGLHTRLFIDVLEQKFLDHLQSGPSSTCRSLCRPVHRKGLGFGRQSEPYSGGVHVGVGRSRTYDARDEKEPGSVYGVGVGRRESGWTTHTDHLKGGEE